MLGFWQNPSTLMFLPFGQSRQGLHLRPNIEELAFSL